jgi:protein O-GlcNAc transferase
VSRRWPSAGTLALLTLALLTVLVGCASKPTTGVQETKGLKLLQARAAYDRGVQHMSARETAAAYIAFREAALLDETSATYRDALGVVLLQLRRTDLALPEFERAVVLDPSFANAVFHVGLALTEMQRWAEAVASLEKAVAMPTLPVPQLAWQTLGVAMLNLGRLSEAEGALRFAVNLDPDMSSAYYNLGLVLVRAHRMDEARAAFRRTRELAPESAFGQAAAERLKTLGEGG